MLALPVRDHVIGIVEDTGHKLVLSDGVNQSVHQRGHADLPDPCAGPEIVEAFRFLGFECYVHHEAPSGANTHFRSPAQTHFQ